MTLKPGDKVYRVVECDPPEGSHTWQIESREVAQASDKRITLKSYFSGIYRMRWDAIMLGRMFHATPLDALTYFINSKRSEIESLESRVRDAERALVWATTVEATARKVS